MVDASIAFNSLNRKVAMKNIQLVCPNLSQYIENTYQDAARLYIAGGSGEFLYSSEGLTQGNNIAMAFYALGTVPIIRQLHNVDDDIIAEPVKQVWFADDSSAAGLLKGILQWWEKLTEIGPKYGYNPNPRKCVLIVKIKETELEAQKLFSEYGIEITTEGKRHLGAVIGTKEFKNEYKHDLVNNWVDDVKLLAEIVRSEPQSAYAAMVFAVQHRWKFALRTIPEIAEYLKVLEFEIHHSLLP